jgi:hypothetical protein
LPELLPSNPEPVSAMPRSPRETLDEKKKGKIIALLANGSSRRMAARFVGCSASTIVRTAMRDLDFARQVLEAEQNTEIDTLPSLRIAARKDRYWRAAAWLLERRNPEDFARRLPEVLTKEELHQLLDRFVESLLKDLPEENYQRIMASMDEFLQYCAMVFKKNPGRFSRMNPRNRRLRSTRLPRCPKLRFRRLT